MINLGKVTDAAVEVERFCLARNWKHCFIGGVAVQRGGNPRITQDVDLTLLTGFSNEEHYIDEIFSAFIPRRPDARNFALQQRVLLAATKTGTNVDISLGGLDFERHSIDRATPWTFKPLATITTCSAEDLITHKVFAGRDRDWGDVESIVVAQFSRLNLALIRNECAALLELNEDTDSLPKLDALVEKVRRRLRSP